MDVTRVVVAIFAGVLFLIVLNASLLSIPLAMILRNPESASQSLEKSGAIDLLYDEVLTAVIADSADNLQRSGLVLGDSTIDITLDTPEQREALAAIVRETVPPEELTAFIDDVSKEFLLFARGEVRTVRTMPVSELLDGLPEAYAAHSAELGISAQISDMVSLDANTPAFLTSFERIGVVLTEEEGYSLYKEIFSEEWADNLVESLLREVVRYLNSDEVVFEYRMDIADRFSPMRDTFREKVDEAARSGDLRIGPLFGPILRGMFSVGVAGALPPITDDELDAALTEAGLQVWTAQQAKQVTDAFVEYLTGSADPDIVIDFSSDRSAVEAVLTNLVITRLEMVLADTPDCTNDQEEQIALQTFQDNRLPSCIPGVSIIAGGVLGDGVIGGLGNAFLNLLEPFIGSRPFILQAIAPIVETNIQNILPASITYRWSLILAELSPDARANLNRQRTLIVNGLSFTQVDLIESGLDVVFDRVRNEYPLISAVDEFLLNGSLSRRITALAIVNWPLGFVIALILLIVTALAGGRKVFERLQWAGTFLMIGTFWSAVSLSLSRFALGRFAVEDVPFRNFTIAEYENLTALIRSRVFTEAVAAIVNELFGFIYVYAVIAFFIGLILLISSILLTRRHRNTIN